jgi:hypothetical protein
VSHGWCLLWAGVAPDGPARGHGRLPLVRRLTLSASDYLVALVLSVEPNGSDGRVAAGAPDPARPDPPLRTGKCGPSNTAL